MSVTVGVPRESTEGERRVALVPDAVKRLVKRGVTVLVEPGAGEGALFPDTAYADAGARVAEGGTSEVWDADVVVKVAPPGAAETGRLRPGAVLVGFLAPLTSPHTVRALRDRRVTALAMEAVPRISRAQSMDALSSQSSVSGYLAALLAAQHTTRFFPMLTTAAGTVPPARVLVLGAGVAGLQALATARRIGARTTGYDVRPGSAEQVRSLGAAWLDVGVEADGSAGYARQMSASELDAQQRALTKAMADFDAVITTALVPGRPAPVLVTAEGVARMRPGSVVVDLAGEAGGNCEVSVAGETVVHGGVRVLAPLNLPSRLPEHASQLYARNVESLLGLLLTDEGTLGLDLADEILAGACITHAGEVLHPGARQKAEEVTAA